MSINLSAGPSRPLDVPGGGREYRLASAACRTDGMADRRAPGAGRKFRLLMKESRENNAYSPRLMRKNMRKLLGLKEVRGPRGQVRTVHDPAEQKIWPEEIPLLEISRELLGGDFVDGLHDDETGSQTYKLREALAPITASTQQDVNAYSIYIGGLIEQKFLEGYQLPDFIGRTLVHHETTQVREQRIYTEAHMNMPDRVTQEGQEYPNQGINPRWIIRPPVIKYGQKASLTRESVVFGLGQQLLQAVEGGGKALGYLEDYLIAATVQGQDIPVGFPGFVDGYTVNTYLYNAQPNDAKNATYQTSVGTGASLKYNYANKFTGKPLLSWQDLAYVRGKLALMKEFETGYRILSRFEDVVVSPAAHDNAEVICHSKQVFPVYGGSGLNTAGAALAQGGGTFASNPAGNAALRIHSSPIWNQQLVDSGQTQSNADQQWFAGCIKKSFAWVSIWDTRVLQANTLSSELVGSDIVGEWVYSWFGVPVVWDPRHILYLTQ